jgi:hypothetical protein
VSLERDELEEMAAGARDVARVTKAQYDAFVESGFSAGQALTLTGKWLAAQLGGGEA